MPLLLIVRFFLSLFSWALVGVAAYLLWAWYQGDYVANSEGVWLHVRESWRLWTGLGVSVWSLGGGSLLLRPFLAKPDREPLNPHRGDGEIIDGANGAKLYVETSGPQDGPCLILTHGWGLDSTIWAYARRDLSKTFRLVLWDLPGMGKSRAGPDGVHLSCFAEDLARVIDYSGARRVVLVGHSIGGMTTQTLARDRRDLFEAPEAFENQVAGVVLVNTTDHNPLDTMIFSKLALALRPVIEVMMRVTTWLEPLAMLSAWQGYLNGSAHIANRLGFGPHVTHSQLNHTAYLSSRNSQRAQALGNLSMFRWDATGAFAGLDTPVLVLGGKLDILTKPEASRAIAASARKGQLHLVDDANHMGFVECAAVYNQAIARFAAQALVPQAAADSAVAPLRRPLTA